VRAGRSLVPPLRLGQAGDGSKPGLVVPPRGARVGLPHGVLEVAERPSGTEVERRERVLQHARSEVASQVGWQAGLGGEAAHGLPYVGGE